MVNKDELVLKLIKDSFIIKKKTKMHSRQRARLRKEERRLGRHTGLGKRHGTAEARMPQKVLWVRRQRTLRRLLKKYREAKKIDRHMYQELYLACKAGTYKSKKNLADAIEKMIYRKNLEGKTGTQKAALKEEKKAREIVEQELKQTTQRVDQLQSQIQDRVSALKYLIYRKNATKKFIKKRSPSNKQ